MIGDAAGEKKSVARRSTGLDYSSLQRWIGRREYYGEVYLAIAGLVSDRAVRR